jgi:hypothetical protein
VPADSRGGEGEEVKTEEEDIGEDEEVRQGQGPVEAEGVLRKK